jgi:hypothetical protein
MTIRIAGDDRQTGRLVEAVSRVLAPKPFDTRGKCQVATWLDLKRRVGVDVVHRRLDVRLTEIVIFWKERVEGPECTAAA